MFKACRCNKTLRRILKRTKCSSRHLWTRARQVDPSLKTILGQIDLKLKLSTKEMRLIDAKRFSKQSLERFMSLVYVDECKLILRKPGPYKLIGSRGQKVKIEAALTSVRTIPKAYAVMFSIILAVHPVHGCIYWALLSSSSGVKRKGRFKVSETP